MPGAQRLGAPNGTVWQLEVDWAPLLPKLALERSSKAIDADAAAFRSFVRGAVAARHEHPVLRSGALRVTAAV